MENEDLTYVRQELLKTYELFRKSLADEDFIRNVAVVAGRVCEAIRAGGKLLVAGNGGSAADAQHIAAELVSRFNFDRPPLAAIALTTDTSILTAIGNDYGYEQLFARQVRALGRPNDVLLALSTSGRSPNILAGIDAAAAIGVVTVGLTGDRPSDFLAKCDYVISVPSDQTPLIQHLHIAVGHIICGFVEAALFPRQSS